VSTAAVIKQNLIKHSGAIHITNKLSNIQRKVYNVMLYYASPQLPNEEEIKYHEQPIKLLMKDCEFSSRNLVHFKEAIMGIMSEKVVWNILGKDKDGSQDWWSISGLFSEVHIRDGVCRWVYPPSLRRILSHPSVYARLNLKEQAVLKGRHTIPIWELMWDALGSKRSSCEYEIAVEQLRELLGLDKKEYTEFKIFNRDLLSKAIKEINESAALSIEYAAVRHERKVSKIRFKICRKTASDIQTVEAAPGDGNRTLDRLLKLGFHQKKATELLNKYDEQVLNQAMDYVLERQKMGQVISNPQGYLIGVLGKGFTGVIQKGEAQGTKDFIRKVERMFYEHRALRAKEEYEALSDTKKEEFKKDFLQNLCPADLVELNAFGFDKAENVQLRFTEYLAKELLRDENSEDANFNLFLERYKDELVG
jgi:hypothetical protein